MSSVQEQQLAKRRRDEQRKFNIFRLDRLKKEIDTSVKSFLSEVFSQWRLYKRFYEQLAVIQRFIRSIWYIIKMRILKKNHREPDSATHSALQFDRFIILEQNREAGISLSRDLKNNELTRLRAFLRGFVRTHSPVVNEPAFIQKLREMLNRNEFDYIQNLMGSQSFIEFFESTRKTRDDIYNGCSTARSMRMRISDWLWILYYLSSERLPKSWFPNPESDFMFVFEELRTIVRQNVQEEEEHDRAIMEMGPPEQPDYFPEHCPQCGFETIQGTCFDTECVRRRESACASCGNPIIEGSNVVELDGMRLHQDCANHNQHNSHFRDYTECSFCGCSSNDMTFVEEYGLICDRCISANQ
jgi:hypothetical protein